MPELPEVETVRRGLEPHLAGARIRAVETGAAGLRFPFPENLAARLAGQRVETVGRRAKYLLFGLSSGETLLSHLGMTGSYRFDFAALAEPSRYRDTDKAGKHDHLVFRLDRDGSDYALVYNDPRRFGFVDLVADPARSPFLAGLGPEPLGNALTATGLAARFAGRRTPVKPALLDQRVVAGLGNIYVSEALWRAGVVPTRPVGTLVDAAGAPRPDLEALVRAIRSVLEDAIAAGGSTLKDFRHADGELGHFQHRFDVYDRAGEACRRPGCAGTIARIVQSGRASYYCPACQAESG